MASHRGLLAEGVSWPTMFSLRGDKHRVLSIDDDIIQVVDQELEGPQILQTALQSGHYLNLR